MAAAGTKMQIFLTVEGLGLSLLLAAVLTYLWERPWRRWILEWGRKEAEEAPAPEEAPEPILETPPEAGPVSTSEEQEERI